MSLLFPKASPRNLCWCVCALTSSISLSLSTAFVPDFSLYPPKISDWGFCPDVPDIFGWAILCCGELTLCTVRGFSSISGCQQHPPLVMTIKNVCKHYQMSPGGLYLWLRTTALYSTVCTNSSMSKYELLWIGYLHLKGHYQNSPLRVNFGVVREFTRFSISRWISLVSPVSYKWRTWQEVKKEKSNTM